MTDPQPLTDDELAAKNDQYIEAGVEPTAIMRRLVATVMQMRRERDTLRLRFAALVEGVLSFAEAETNAIVAAGLRAMVEDDDDIRDYRAVVAAVRDADTLRQARQLARRADKAMGEYEEEEADNANDALYALLLSSPPSPDTPTPTGSEP